MSATSPSLMTSQNKPTYPTSTTTSTTTAAIAAAEAPTETSAGLTAATGVTTTVEAAVPPTAAAVGSNPGFDVKENGEKAAAIEHLSRLLHIKPVPKKFPHIIHQGRVFILCNEDYTANDIAGKLKELAQAKPKAPDHINMGLIVGGGHILSLLPEYSEFLEVIAFVDVNDEGLKHNLAIIELLLRSKDINDFKREYPNTLKALGMVGSLSSLVTDFFKKQAEQVGDSYFLKDEARFQLCKASCAKLKFITHQIDLSNLELVRNFLNAVDSVKIKTKICLLNITNLPGLETPGQMQNAVNALCRDVPTILYSYRFVYNTSSNRLVCHTTEDPNFKLMTKQVYATPELAHWMSLSREEQSKIMSDPSFTGKGLNNSAAIVARRSPVNPAPVLLSRPLNFLPNAATAAAAASAAAAAPEPKDSVAKKRRDKK